MTEKTNEFYAMCAMIDKVIYDTSTPIHQMPFTDDQMRLLCVNIRRLLRSRSKSLLKHPQMTPEYLDLMLTQLDFVVDTDALDIIKESTCIQPRHIERVVEYIGKFADRQSLSFDELVTCTFNHPLCTEAMKVKYHLMRGLYG